MAYGFNIAPQGKIPIDGNSINNMRNAVDILRNINFDKNHFTTTHTGNGLFVGKVIDDKEGFPWGENYTFGITQTAEDKITVWNGKYRRWGDQVYHAADTEVTFAEDGDFYIVWKWSAGSGLIIEDTPTFNYPAESDATYIYGVVHKIRRKDGCYSLLESVQTGIINAPIFSKGDA